MAKLLLYSECAHHAWSDQSCRVTPTCPASYILCINSEPWSSFSVYINAAWMHACSVYIRSLTTCTLQALMKHLKMALKICTCTSMTCTIIYTLFFYMRTRLYNTYLYIVKHLISWVYNKMKHFACNRNIVLSYLHFHLQSLHIYIMYYIVKPLYKWHSDQE